MKENILFSVLAVFLLVMGAANREIIAEYGLVKFAIVGVSDVLLLAGLTLRVESEN